MAYTSSGKLPFERASKVGHIKVIKEPHIQRLVEAFESVDNASQEQVGSLSGHLDLSDCGELENVVAVDGSYIPIPNEIKNHKRLAFFSVSTVVLQRREIEAMQASPIIDPRDLAKRLEDSHETLSWALPLAGISVPGQTLIETIRKLIDEFFQHSGLYPTLQFLLSREWLPSYEMTAYMGCIKCGRDITLPRSKLYFACPYCNQHHTLADYLQLVQSQPDDWAREEVVKMLMGVAENLYLLRFLVNYRDKPLILRRTLFLKDGPLLLSSQLARLVPAVREFLRYLSKAGHQVHVVGTEKTGELVDHVPLIREVLLKPGDYFLPSVRYLQERLKGVVFDRDSYINRVSYGSKVVVRLGHEHTVAFNVPTGEYLLEPEEGELYGFQKSMALLSRMLSSAHENALVPLVLANSVASISSSPSADILETFARRLMK